MFSFYVDDWLMDRAEKISHKIQRTSGIICFQIARTMFLVAMSAMFVFIITALIHPSIGGMIIYDWMLKVMLFIVNTLCIANPLVASWICYKLCVILISEYEKLKDSAGLTNIFRIIGKSHRIANMYLTILFFVAFILMPKNMMFTFAFLGVFVETVGEYFLACTPLPPQKSKMRQWLESFQKIPNPAFDAG
jgi:hypothetical protein